MPADHPEPLFLPGLNHPVTPEEYNDPGAIEVEVGSVTCSTLMARGITEEMERILETDKPLRVAFLNCLGDSDWSEDDYLTEVATGFSFKVEHFSSGELTKEEEEWYWREVRQAKERELKSW